MGNWSLCQHSWGWGLRRDSALQVSDVIQSRQPGVGALPPAAAPPGGLTEVHVLLSQLLTVRASGWSNINQNITEHTRTQQCQGHPLTAPHVSTEAGGALEPSARTEARLEAPLLTSPRRGAVPTLHTPASLSPLEPLISFLGIRPRELTKIQTNVYAERW